METFLVVVLAVTLAGLVIVAFSVFISQLVKSHKTKKLAAEESAVALFEKIESRLKAIEAQLGRIETLLEEEVVEEILADIQQELRTV